MKTYYKRCKEVQKYYPLKIVLPNVMVCNPEKKKIKKYKYCDIMIIYYWVGNQNTITWNLMKIKNVELVCGWKWTIELNSMLWCFY